MVIIIGLVAIAVILLIGVGFHFANGARSGKAGLLAKTEAAQSTGGKPREDRASELN